jgi:hypothetical protein
MPDGVVQLVELLSGARARTDLDCSEGRPIVVLTVRPDPDRSWQPHNLGLTINAAKRLRDDLTALLKAPPAFLLLAFVALASGCSAKVEVTTERSTAAETDSAVPPLAEHRTVVEVDVLGQPTEPGATQVASEQRVTADADSKPGDGVGGVSKGISCKSWPGETQ